MGHPARRPVINVGADGAITDSMIAGYLSKYATKSTEATGHLSRRLTDETIDVHANPDGSHVERLVHACWMLGRPKAWRSLRRPLPEVTWVTVLDHQAAQERERNRAGEAWQDHGLVFSSEVGTPMEPRNLNRHFAVLRERAGMPTVRLHNLRHTVVTLLLELGVPPHLVQAIARHADVGHHDEDLRPQQSGRNAGGGETP